MLLSFAASLILAAGPEFNPNKPPPMVPKEAYSFWRYLHKHAYEQAEAMVRNVAKELGYERSQYTEGDWKCMALFGAWASAEIMRRENPLYCPKSFTDWLERAQKEACDDEDPPNTPGAATGRGWNTVRRAVLGRGDVQREIRTGDALLWLAKAGVLIPTLGPTWVAVGAAGAITNPKVMPDVRPPALRKTDPRDML